MSVANSWPIYKHSPTVRLLRINWAFAQLCSAKITKTTVISVKMEEESAALGSGQEQPESPTTINGKRPPQLKEGKIHRKKPKSEHVNLPATDVRSNYHRIFEMIFNGCPKSVASKHFRSICSDDCVFVSRSINNPFGPNYREVRGISSMVEYVDATLEAIPDCIFAILDSKFFRKAQNESMIISSYTVNGRMIFTVDSLDTEDLEDIDSAISGLQMLYQGRCGSGDDEADIGEAAQIVYNNVTSAAIKKEEQPGDSLYGFVYHPTANEAAAAAAMIASTVVSNKPLTTLASGGNTNTNISNNNNNTVRALPMQALNLHPGIVDGTGASLGNSVSLLTSNNNNTNISNNNTSSNNSSSNNSTTTATSVFAPIVPFDYSLKFTSTGASLFEPSGPSEEDDEQEPLESLGINPLMPGHEGSSSSVVSSSSNNNSSNGRKKVCTISMLANSSSDRINQRVLTSAAAQASATATTATNNVSSAAGGSATTLQSSGASSASLTALSSLGVGGEMSTACKEFWQKQRSNVMIVKEQAKFCLKERVPLAKQIYKVKGTLTLHLNADKKVKRIELLNSFDTNMHR